MAEINKKYLDGIVIRESGRKETEENGEKKMVYVVTERPAETADVLASRETTSEITFVTVDGQKYTRTKTK
jgi:hypothetical protein